MSNPKNMSASKELDKIKMLKLSKSPIKKAKAGNMMARVSLLKDTLVDETDVNAIIENLEELDNLRSERSELAKYRTNLEGMLDKLKAENEDNIKQGNINWIELEKERAKSAQLMAANTDLSKKLVDAQQIAEHSEEDDGMED